MMQAPFVGRRREAKRIIAELRRGNSLIVTGAWGMGRTALARHVSERMIGEARFYFVDFSCPPAEVCRRLALTLFPQMARHEKHQHLHLGKTRFALVARPLGADKRLVLVFDDIAKMSHAKLDLLRRLSDAGRFQTLAVVERFLPDRDLLRIRSLFQAGPALVLDRLSFEETEKYFTQASERHDLQWSTGEIRGMARAAAGYPLGMVQILSDELRRRTGQASRTGIGARFREILAKGP